SDPKPTVPREIARKYWAFSDPNARAVNALGRQIPAGLGGRSQGDLARDAGYDPGEITRFANGTRFPTQDGFQRLDQALWPGQFQLPPTPTDPRQRALSDCWVFSTAESQANNRFALALADALRRRGWGPEDLARATHYDLVSLRRLLEGT